MLSEASFHTLTMRFCQRSGFWGSLENWISPIRLLALSEKLLASCVTPASVAPLVIWTGCTSKGTAGVIAGAGAGACAVLLDPLAVEEEFCKPVAPPPEEDVSLSAKLIIPGFALSFVGPDDGSTHLWIEVEIWLKFKNSKLIKLYSNIAEIKKTMVAKKNVEIEEKKVKSIIFINFKKIDITVNNKLNLTNIGLYFWILVSQK